MTTFEPVNLDAMAVSELDTFCQDVANPMALRDYARRKARAMQYRLGGMITSAMVCEADCDSLYDRLPDEWKW
jgi:hypothetical protein